MLNYRQYTKDEAKHMAENYRLNDNKKLQSLNSWNNPIFRNIIFGFIKAMGYSDKQAGKEKERELKKYEDVEEKRQQAMLINKLIEAEIPSRYYDSYKYKIDFWEQGIKKFDEFINTNKKTKSNLYIYGESYTGKSHLVAYCLLELVKKGVDCFWVNVPDFFGMCNERIFKDKVHEVKIKMYTTKILILDDIFKRSFFQTGNTQVTGAASILYSIIEKRLGKHSTVYIDEKDINDEVVKNSVSQACINRIKDNAIFLKGTKKYYTM